MAQFSWLPACHLAGCWLRPAPAIGACLGLGLAACTGTGVPGAGAVAEMKPTRTLRIFALVLLAEAFIAYQRNELGAAAEEGDLEKVRALLASGTPVDDRDDAGRTAMHHAARSGYYAVLELLIEKGGDLNARTATGHTPLHEAAAESQLETAKILVESGADTHVQVSDKPPKS